MRLCIRRTQQVEDELGSHLVPYHVDEHYCWELCEHRKSCRDTLKEGDWKMIRCKVCGKWVKNNASERILHLEDNHRLEYLQAKQGKRGRAGFFEEWGPKGR